MKKENLSFWIFKGVIANLIICGIIGFIIAFIISIYDSSALGENFLPITFIVIIFNGIFSLFSSHPDNNKLNSFIIFILSLVIVIIMGELFF